MNLNNTSKPGIDLTVETTATAIKCCKREILLPRGESNGM